MEGGRWARALTRRTSRAKSLDPKHLREAGRTRASADARRMLVASASGGGDGGGGGGGDDDIRLLLEGPPLGAAGYDPTVVDRCIAGVRDLIDDTYPVDPADLRAADADFQRLRRLPWAHIDNLVCKRAFVLFAMHMEPEVAAHFAAGPSSAMACDLRDRVLPVLVPMFVRDMCQRPDVFVRMASVLHHMWGGEDLTAVDGSTWHPAPPKGAPKRCAADLAAGGAAGLVPA